FLGGMNYFGDLVDQQIETLAKPNVPQALVDAGNSLHRAQYEIRAIDNQYASFAEAHHASVKDGLVQISKTPEYSQLRDQMGSEMRVVLARTGIEYKRVHTQLDTPPESNFDVTSSPTGNSDPSAIGQ